MWCLYGSLVAVVLISVSASYTPNVCSFNGQVHKPGDIFVAECNICNCEEYGGVMCTYAMCIPGVEYAQCTKNGVTYNHGEKFTDGCRQCVCKDAEEICRETSDCPSVAKRSYSPNVCSFSGEVHKPGDIFVAECNICNCEEHGGVMCSWRMCIPGYEYDQCTKNGVTHEHGEKFTDGCRQCVCNDGEEICRETPDCPSVAKRMSRPNQCSYDGEAHNPGDIFVIECNTCGCRDNGLFMCTLLPCIPGYEYAQCTKNGVTYNHGEKFTDGCRQCVCKDGNSLCRETSDCPSVA